MLWELLLPASTFKALLTQKNPAVPLCSGPHIISALLGVKLLRGSWLEVKFEVRLGSPRGHSAPGSLQPLFGAVKAEHGPPFSLGNGAGESLALSPSHPLPGISVCEKHPSAISSPG